MGEVGSIKIICGSSHRIEIPKINTTDKDEDAEILNKEAFKGNFWYACLNQKTLISLLRKHTIKLNIVPDAT